MSTDPVQQVREIEGATEDVAEPSIPEPRQIPLHETFLLKPNTALRQHADRTICVQARRINERGDSYEHRSFIFFTTAKRFHAFSESGGNPTMALINVVKPMFPPHKPEDEHHYQVLYELRSFNESAEEWHVKLHHRVDPNRLLENMDKLQSDKNKAEEHMGALMNTLFSHEMRGIVEKMVSLKNRGRFLKMIHSQCHSGTDEFLDHYSEPSVMEYISNRCRDANWPPMHSLRVMHQQDLVNDEREREWLYSKLNQCVAHLRRLMRQCETDGVTEVPETYEQWKDNEFIQYKPDGS